MLEARDEPTVAFLLIRIKFRRRRAGAARVNCDLESAHAPKRKAAPETASMIRSNVALLIASLLACALAIAAEPAPTPDRSRGELLYSTHCVSCHTAQIHWRDKRLVTDWPSLKAQVRRWQSNVGLNWNADDIVEVARRLNTLYYHYPQTADQVGLNAPR